MLEKIIVGFWALFSMAIGIGTIVWLLKTCGLYGAIWGACVLVLR